MRFNHLVAIEKAESRGGHTYWKFKCDCGLEKEIMTCHVINGAVKSCGCLIDSIRDISADFSPNDPKARVCKICENRFFGFIGDTRVFCYNCSPRGASVADAHRAQKRAMKHILVEYKGGECVECGYDKCDGSLQFHHLNENDKDFSIASIKPNKVTMADLRAEVDKCALLCANCHSKKHMVDDVVGFVMKLATKHECYHEDKVCIVCNTEFVAKHHGRNYCYSCVPYNLNTKEGDRARKRAVKQELLKYKGGAVCASCGYDEYEGALHFHHRNPEEKEFNFANQPLNSTDYNMDRMRKEADKCDVLCANCHFEVHYKNNDDLEE